MIKLDICNYCEISFNEIKCPLCVARYIIKELEDEISELNAQISSMEESSAS